MTKYEYATKVLKTRKAIKIDDALMRGLGYNSTRDFFKELGDWGYCADFGRFSFATDDKTQSYLRAFLRDCFID